MSRILVLVVLVASMFFVGACAPKAFTPATELLYEGEINGPYVSSDRVVEEVLAVRDCMGVTDRPFPLPTIRALSGGTGVQCGDFVARGCYIGGVIIVPNNVEIDVIAHEAVHHYLFLDTGDPDPEHKSDWFLKCGGSVKAE